MEITKLVESAQYVTNYHGQQTAVMLPIDVWDRLLEVLQNGEEQTEGVEDRIMGEDDGIPSVAEVVARIKATPPNPAMIRQATGSVEDLTPSDPDAEFDLDAWERDWGAAMEEVRRTNYIAYRNKGRI